MVKINFDDVNRTMAKQIAKGSITKKSYLSIIKDILINDLCFDASFVYIKNNVLFIGSKSYPSLSNLTIDNTYNSYKQLVDTINEDLIKHKMEFILNE